MSYIDSILVIPAHAGIQWTPLFWIPAFAGMTKSQTFFVQLSIIAHSVNPYREMRSFKKQNSECGIKKDKWKRSLGTVPE